MALVSAHPFLLFQGYVSWEGAVFCGGTDKTAGSVPRIPAEGRRARTGAAEHGPDLPHLQIA